MHPKKTFTTEQKAEIIKLNETMTQENIAKQFNCTRRHLSKVINANKPKDYDLSDGNGNFDIEKYRKICM